MLCILKNFIYSVLFFLSWALPTNGYGAFYEPAGKVPPAVISIFKTLKPWIESRNSHLSPEDQLSCEELNRVFEAQEPLLKDLNKVSQKFFLRPATAERTDLLDQPEDSLLNQKREELLKLFEEIGHINPIKPSHPAYNYILFNGATVWVMRERLKTLISYVEERRVDLRNTKLVLLTGERDLFKNSKKGEWEKKNLEDLPSSDIDPQWQKPEKLPETEDQALKWIWEQTKLPAPLRDLNLVWVIAKKKRDQGGNWVRPNTFDTVDAWFKQENPQPGVCLVLSSQPFVSYQQEVLKTVLLQSGKEGFTLEGVGNAPSKEQMNAPGAVKILLDNLARFLFEKQKQQSFIEANKAKD